jgi:eukaryotic-like serine/threonine-protein kinase
MPLQPGDLLLNGKYVIRALIGRGGFGFVYLADDTLLHEPVALKELIPALVGDEEILRRFLGEARATMRLTHERIVRTHDVFVERGNYYIAMEYMAGGSLEARLKEGGAPPVEAAVRVAAEVCEGLAYAHAHGVVHCDLKPANVLFDDQGRAKVADFGIAHIPAEMYSRSRVTQAGFVAGTLPYMSPEQADGVRDDPRVDVYAAGAVLYRMLTGRPYLEFDTQETPGAQARNVGRIQAEDPVAPSTHNRRVPAWLDAVVLKALAKRREERYGSAAALREALLRHEPPPALVVPAVLPRAEPGLAPPPRGPAPPASRPPRRGLPAWFWPGVGGAGLLLVLALLLAVWSTGRGADRPPPTAVLGHATAPVPATSTERPLKVTKTPASPTPTGVARPPTVAPSPRPPTAAPPVILYPQGLLAYTTGPDGRWQIAVTDPAAVKSWLPPGLPPNSGVPAWLPEAGRLGFRSKATGAWQIYTIGLDGSDLQQITSGGYDNLEAAWSPDGRKVAFVSRRDGNKEIYLMDAGGSSQVRLTANAGGDDDPNWSPDGEWLVFESTRGNRLDVYKMRSDGSELARLTSGGRSNSTPAWSPDGSRIAFERQDGDVTHIWTMDADGGGPQQLTFEGKNNLRPAWSPDGREIAITSDRDGTTAVWIIPADGGGAPRRASVSEGWDAAWSRPQ